MVMLDADLAMDEVITISKDDKDRIRYSKSRLREGMEFTRKDLLLIALAASENRAASALARTYPGGTDAFVEAMNTKAHDLGLSKTRFADPARFSFAHGGKDGHPFPVPTKVYDETISMLSNAVDRAKLDRSDKQHALRSLHETAKRIEKDFIPNDNFDKLIEKEWAESQRLGGRTVFDGGDQETVYEKRKRKIRGRNAQLSLFGEMIWLVQWVNAEL